MALMARLLVGVSLFLLTGCQEPQDVLPHVAEITPQTLRDVVRPERHVLVLFYASWCGHCKSLAPDYGLLGYMVAHSDGKDALTVAKVDADRHRNLGSLYRITGYPTIKFFRNDSSPALEYPGDRTAEGLVAFLRDQTGFAIPGLRPTSYVVRPTEAEFHRLLAVPAQWVLAYFHAPWCTHCTQLAAEVEQIAETFRTESKVVVVKVDANDSSLQAIMEDFGVADFPSLKLFMHGNHTVEDYTGGRTAPELIDFLNRKAGTHRKVGGMLSQHAGRAAACDALVAGFLHAEGPERRRVLQEVRRLLPTTEAAALYLKVAQKILSRGDEYPHKELARLQKLIHAPGLTLQQQDSFVLKYNVLTAFFQQRR
eukprot:EG_transcript_11592